MATRVAVVNLVLPDYKVHVYRALSRRPGWELMLWHGPAVGEGTPADSDPRGEFEHRSARNMRLGRLGLVWQRMHEELWAFRPDVILIEEFIKVASHWPLLLEARRRGVPVVVYGHGENLQRRVERGRLVGEAVEVLRGRMHAMASALLVYTEGTAAALRARRPKPRAFVAVNTLDFALVDAALAPLPADHRERVRESLGCRADSLLVGSVGRLITHHDPRPVMKQVLRARAAGVDAHLMHIGSGPIAPEVDAWIAALPASDRAALHRSPRQDLAETTRRLAACDIYVQPGTVGLAANHAMVLGLPFIAHRHEAHGPEIEYVEHERNGLVLPDFGSSLVTALVGLGREPAWRATLAEGARRYAREKLSPDKQVAGFVAAIEHALGQASGRAPARRYA